MRAEPAAGAVEPRALEEEREAEEEVLLPRLAAPVPIPSATRQRLHLSQEKDVFFFCSVFSMLRTYRLQKQSSNSSNYNCETIEFVLLDCAPKCSQKPMSTCATRLRSGKVQKVRAIFKDLDDAAKITESNERWRDELF